MKALIKGGLCLALGWMATRADAQDTPWRAAAPSNNNAPAVSGSTAAPSISLARPTPLNAAPEPPRVAGSFTPIVRGQAADDKIDPPRPFPKEGQDFTPPTPTPIPPPPSLFGSVGTVGIGDDCGCGCGDGCRPSWWAPRLNLGCGDDCCPERPRFWISAEYLMWWQKGQNVPPLVTGSAAGDPVPKLGQSTTSILYDGVPNELRSGGRFGVGMWLPHFDNRLGIEVNYFFLARQDNTASFSSAGGMQLGRPFVDVTPGLNLGNLDETFAGNGFAGSATVHSFSQIWGIEGNLRYKWCCGPGYWIDIIGGYRNMNLSEGIDITETAQMIAAPNSTTVERESFHTRNQFNGFQLGFDSEYRLWNRWFIGATAKLAMGDVHEIIDINGTTTFLNFPGLANSVQQGALLASPTNIGRYTADRFAVLPEMELKIGFDITPNLRVFVGYDFLCLSSVVRPGDQIDPRVNGAYTPTAFGPGIGSATNSQPRLPTVLYQQSSYWAQGLTFGLQYRF